MQCNGLLLKLYTLKLIFYSLKDVIFNKVSPFLNIEQTPTIESHFITSLRYWASSWETYLYPIEKIPIPIMFSMKDFTIIKKNKKYLIIQNSLYYQTNSAVKLKSRATYSFIEFRQGQLLIWYELDIFKNTEMTRQENSRGVSNSNFFRIPHNPFKTFLSFVALKSAMWKPGARLQLKRVKSCDVSSAAGVSTSRVNHLSAGTGNANTWPWSTLGPRITCFISLALVAS